MWRGRCWASWRLNQRSCVTCGQSSSSSGGTKRSRSDDCGQGRSRWQRRLKWGPAAVSAWGRHLDPTGKRFTSSSIRHERSSLDDSVENSRLVLLARHDRLATPSLRLLGLTLVGSLFVPGFRRWLSDRLLVLARATQLLSPLLFWLPDVLAILASLTPRIDLEDGDCLPARASRNWSVKAYFVAV
jgi:hypothetical protein